MFLLTYMDLVVFAPSQEHITPERTFAAGGYIKQKCERERRESVSKAICSLCAKGLINAVRGERYNGRAVY